MGNRLGSGVVPPPIRGLTAINVRKWTNDIFEKCARNPYFSYKDSNLLRSFVINLYRLYSEGVIQ